MYMLSGDKIAFLFTVLQESRAQQAGGGWREEERGGITVCGNRKELRGWSWVLFSLCFCFRGGSFFWLVIGGQRGRDCEKRYNS